MNLVTRVNWEQMEVEKKMCEALNELFAEELKRGRSEREKQKDVKKDMKRELGWQNRCFSYLPVGNQ